MAHHSNDSGQCAKNLELPSSDSFGEQYSPNSELITKLLAEMRELRRENVQLRGNLTSAADWLSEAHSQPLAVVQTPTSEYFTPEASAGQQPSAAGGGPSRAPQRRLTFVEVVKNNRPPINCESEMPCINKLSGSSSYTLRSRSVPVVLTRPADSPSAARRRSAVPGGILLKPAPRRGRKRNSSRCGRRQAINAEVEQDYMPSWSGSNSFPFSPLVLNSTPQCPSAACIGQTTEDLQYIRNDSIGQTPPSSDGSQRSPSPRSAVNFEASLQPKLPHEADELLLGAANEEWGSDDGRTLLCGAPHENAPSCVAVTMADPEEPWSAGGRVVLRRGSARGAPPVSLHSMKRCDNCCLANCLVALHHQHAPFTRVSLAKSGCINSR